MYKINYMKIRRIEWFQDIANRRKRAGCDDETLKKIILRWKEKVMLGLSFREWTKQRFSHEMEENKDNVPKNYYLSCLELINSEYWDLLDNDGYWRIDMPKEKGSEWLNQRPPKKFSTFRGVEVIDNASLLAECESLWKYSNETMIDIALAVEKLEEKGHKIEYLGPKGVKCFNKKLIKYEYFIK